MRVAWIVGLLLGALMALEWAEPEDTDEIPTTCEECGTDAECEALCPMED